MAIEEMKSMKVPYEDGGWRLEADLLLCCWGFGTLFCELVKEGSAVGGAGRPKWRGRRAALFFARE